jgi:hypothetical protein
MTAFDIEVRFASLISTRMEPIPPWTEAMLSKIYDLRLTMVVAIREIQRELELPELSRVVEAAGLAIRDAQRAFQSSYLFLVLVGRPIFLLLKKILRPLLLYLWMVVRSVCGWLNTRLVPWVLHSGGAQIRSLAVAVYDFHKRRTPKELLAEASIVGIIVLIYRLYRVVQHHQWVARSRILVSGKLRAVQQVSLLWCTRVVFVYCVFVQQESRSEKEHCGSREPHSRVE